MRMNVECAPDMARADGPDTSGWTPAALVVEHLCVGHRELGAFIEDVSLEIASGEVLALVGESGCGKSLTALALMRLLPRGFEVTDGAILLGDDAMPAKSECELNAIRGRRVAMLFQQPQSMLDPTSTAGAQVAEPLRLHLGMSRRNAGRRVVELLREVGIPEPEYRARNYAFQLSGGMAQRVMIAAHASPGDRLEVRWDRYAGDSSPATHRQFHDRREQ